MSEEKQGLFDKLYAASKDIIDAAKKPLIKGSIKRKLASAYDDASGKINEAELKMQANRVSFDKYDVNLILEQQAVIDKCKELQNRIKGEYQTLFAKEMVIEQD